MSVWFQKFYLSFPVLFVVFIFYDVTSVLTSVEDNYWKTSDHDSNKVWLWNIEEYPNPQTRPRNCRRFKKSFVCDPDEILPIEKSDELDVLIEEIRTKTPCICPICNETSNGITIGVALLRNMFLPYGKFLDLIAKDFAESLLQNWKFGNCEDDILILISTDDHRSYTAFGSTVTKILSVEATAKIFLENRVYFIRKDYFGGLQSMIKAYSTLFMQAMTQKNLHPTKKADIGLIVGTSMALLLVLIVGIAIFVYWWRKRNSNDDQYSWEESDSLRREYPKEKPEHSYLPVGSLDETDIEKTDNLKLESLSEADEEEEVLTQTDSNSLSERRNSETQITDL